MLEDIFIPINDIAEPLIGLCQYKPSGQVTSERCDYKNKQMHMLSFKPKNITDNFRVAIRCLYSFLRKACICMSYGTSLLRFLIHNNV